jgi:hypothetical protein
VKLANACTNPDLFWALKGGGSGFGVVMSGRRPPIKGYFSALREVVVRSCLRPSFAEN